MSKSKRRPQATKTTARLDYVEGMQNLRRSSATSPIPSGTKYKRVRAGARRNRWSED